MIKGMFLKLPLEGCRQGRRRASEPQEVSESLKWFRRNRKGDLIIVNHCSVVNNTLSLNKSYSS